MANCGAANLEPTQEELFNVTLNRLTIEVFRLRSHLAILKTLKKREQICRRSKFLVGVVDTIRSDVLIRLVRLFEESGRVCSFWYLHRSEGKRVSEGLDIRSLREFSRRIKSIRDKTFVHIDAKGVFNPQAIYKAAGIKDSEISDVVEKVFQVLGKLNYETFPNPPKYHLELTQDQLLEIYEKDFEALGIS